MNYKEHKEKTKKALSENKIKFPSIGKENDKIVKAFLDCNHRCNNINKKK